MHNVKANLIKNTKGSKSDINHDTKRHNINMTKTILRNFASI
jgi:hypothetical protein